MSEEELYLWFYDLPEPAKMYHARTTVLDPNNLPWNAFRTYRDLDKRVYRPFNEETMDWWEYVHTSDYLVHLHHQKKAEHEEQENAAKFRANLVQDGVALAESMSLDEELSGDEPPPCEGCRYNEPSQRFHTCL